MPDVFMPRLSDTMEEGTIAQWLKSEGDTVERGDVLAEIETDKAVMDLEAYDAGVLEKIIVGPGETVPIGEQIAVIGDGSGSSGGGDKDQAEPEKGGDAAAADDEAGQDEAGQGEAGQGEAGQDEAGPEEAEDTGAAEAVPEEGDGGGEPARAPAPRDQDDKDHKTRPAEPAAAQHRLKASPVVRSLARTHGIDLSSIRGTGPGGRIIRADVEGLLAEGQDGKRAPKRQAEAAEPSQAPAKAAPDAAAAAAGAEDERIPLSQIRKVTAKRLSEAALVPAFQLTTVLDATGLTDLRGRINASLADAGGKVSVTDLLVRAAAVMLRAHPEVNASFDGDAIIRRGRVNVGVAVALDDGLIVPVVKDADRKSVSEISREVKDLAKRARDGKLKPDEFSGGTFTISNLGMYGIDNFTAVLNPPEAAILAVGSTAEEPVVIDGEVQVRARTRLTLTVDHRVLDGATGAAFLRDLTDLLAEPLRVLV